MNYIAELEREKAHADGMAAAARMWMKRAQEAEEMLAYAVLSAGGEIIIDRFLILNKAKVTLSREGVLENLTLRLRARRQEQKA